MSLKQPVQYPVRYYSHLDAGAPQLADIDGNIKTILKAGLVTGIGTKEGAGWTALFEDDYRIVLRRPLGTGNPPDIKIENGVINGTASHRIVSQDNPTGVNDTTEIAAVNLLARDSAYGQEWHLIVSDFGFLLCYQMGENGRAGDKNYLTYCGGVQKLRSADSEYFVATTDSKVTRNGIGNLFLGGFFYNSIGVRNMRSNALITDKKIINIAASELFFDDDYLAQPIIIGSRFNLPCYCSVPDGVTDTTTKQVTINNRPMLRYVNKSLQGYETRAFYIPLDYWEL